VETETESKYVFNQTSHTIQPPSLEPVVKTKKTINKKPANKKNVKFEQDVQPNTIQESVQPAQTKPKSKVQEEPVSNELCKLITKSEEKPKKQAKYNANK